MATADLERPRYHFTARCGWLNDPNGLFFRDGEYHLYFQHNPAAPHWGNLHWGHAVSDDLLHWRELPTALQPHSAKDQCYSGSAWVDLENHAGFQTGDQPAILVYYTSTGRGECLAYSNDGGLTFREYENNPIIRHRGRDPRILYHRESGYYILVVYEEFNFAAFYRSSNLKDWEFCSRIHGFFECPELFELNGRWVLFGANGRYSIGRFDGREFHPESLPAPLFEGEAYAGQSFSNCDRRIMIFWLRDREGFAGLPYNQQMTLPVELTLHDNTVRVNPAVIPPEAFVVRPEGRNLRLHGWELPPAEELLIVEDVFSLEIFVNSGERYIVHPLHIHRPRILSFGEILIDRHPNGDRLGGAPVNLAAGLRELNAEVQLTGAVGTDPEGDWLLAQLAEKKLSLEHVQRNDYPTMIARVGRDADGDNTFSFTPESASDHIHPDEKTISSPVDVICFGTLAQRSPESAATLAALKDKHPDARFFCDLNLRAPFYNEHTIRHCLQLAHWVKLSAGEAAILAGILNLPTAPEAFCQECANRYGVEVLVITRGPDGGDVWTREEFFHFEATPVPAVTGTVGAGDAFSAGFLYYLACGASPRIAAAAGSARAAMVIAR